MNTVVFLPQAEEEMNAAAQYYESQSQALGSEFLIEVERTTEGISSNPKAAPTIRNGIRRRLLRRFPFGLLYKIEENQILILAAMHLRRRPGYWRDRI